jgi:septal ring factor EnvC (AmiA/AmiB activator)
MQVPSNESGFTITQLIAISAVSVVALGWLVGALSNLLKRDRDSVDKQGTEQQRQIGALWKSHDDIRRLLDDARKDIAVIDDRLQNTIPDMHHYDSKLETLRTRLEGKLDEVLDKLHSTQITLARITPED